MPNGFQWTPEEVRNAERLAKIQAEANAKAYADVQRKLDQQRGDALERQQRTVKTPSSPYLDNGYIKRRMREIRQSTEDRYQIQLANIRARDVNTDAERAQQLKDVAGVLSEWYNYKESNVKSDYTFTGVIGAKTISRRVQNIVQKASTSYPGSKDVEFAWKEYYDFKAKHNL